MFPAATATPEAQAEFLVPPEMSASAARPASQWPVASVASVAPPADRPRESPVHLALDLRSSHERPAGVVPRPFRLTAQPGTLALQAQAPAGVKALAAPVSAARRPALGARQRCWCRV